ncbi:HD domain-containing protein [Oleiharenicola lentus]|uniref:HD domain-containing protein n=1 Tax=Oleiharenicola lentus TaxID=2508720 RepID=UPI003F6741B9
MDSLTEIEKLCEKCAKMHLDADLWAGYIGARAKLFNEVLPYIRASEPHLSDHGPAHIKNVLNNAYELLGKEQCVGKESKKSLEPMEFYFLMLAILFHDVGNVFGRKDHKHRLKEAYEFARGKDEGLLAERRILFKIVEAHGGKTAAGSSDTIGPLESNGLFRAKRVDCRRIAAILRLADELAEGPQRTSLFMQQHFKYAESSQVFHDYASVCMVHIGRDDGRLALVYHIDIMPEGWGAEFDEKRLRALLEFCYQRIVKMELERKYNRHYCSLLAPFKRTEVSFHFHLKRQDLRHELPNIVLTDLILPDDMGPSKFTQDNPAYSVDALMKVFESAVSSASV